MGLRRLQYRRAQAIAQQGGDGLFAQTPYTQQRLQRRDGAPGGYEMLRPCGDFALRGRATGSRFDRKSPGVNPATWYGSKS